MIYLGKSKKRDNRSDCITFIGREGISVIFIGREGISVATA
jgi:hypothetical protein